MSTYNISTECNVTYICVLVFDVKPNLAKILNKTILFVPAASSSGTVWTIVMLVLFSCVVVAIMLYYRRRVANLRAEVNHVVNYMTQEQPSHFDNPVYSRTTTASGPMANGSAIPPLDARTGLLRTMIPNNIFPSLASNGRRQAAAPSHDKYSYPDNNEYGTGQSKTLIAAVGITVTNGVNSRCFFFSIFLGYSIQYHPDNDLKNLEADLTNPNYYKDHVYDEIGLKDTIGKGLIAGA